MNLSFENTVAREFGAIDIVTERGDEGVARIKELTKGVGADAVLECVGTCLREGDHMATWSKEDLRRIAETDDLHISPFRADGMTYGPPTWIWSVAVDDALYVRAYNGTRSRWHQAAMRQKAGRIAAASLTKEVTFEPVTDPINDRVDGAYRAKYAGSPYLIPMISARARSATVQGDTARHRVGEGARRC